jgi:two-component system, NtrC family, response regulator HydG
MSHTIRLGHDANHIVQSVWSQLSFDRDAGNVYLGDERLAVMGQATFGRLRRDLVEALGGTKAAESCARIGFSEGARLARLLQRLQPEASYDDAIAFRDEVQAMGGFAEPMGGVFEVSVTEKRIRAELTWKNSLEADADREAFGVGSRPACWILTGHASGFFTALVGHPVYFQEVECQAVGHRQCRAIGALAPDDALAVASVSQYLRPAASGISDDSGDSSPFQKRKDLIGVSAGLLGALHLLRKVAPTRAVVLVLGESGVGKEMFARLVHDKSPRGNGPFVAVNCAAIPDTLIESELFGVERGAYTGASVSRAGRFERADGGTLFLDEVGSLSLAAQGKLLRALQEGEVERVGGQATRRVDVRIVAATNADLLQAVRAGSFREDLYFRLKVFPIVIPPLRDRREDIPILMNYFMDRYQKVHGRRLAGFTRRAVDALCQYGFPGNVRELEHMIEHAVVMAEEDDVLDLHHFSGFGPELGGGDELQVGVDDRLKGRAGPLLEPLADISEMDEIELLLKRGLDLPTVETQLLVAAVQKAHGNLAEAARTLGITRRQVAYRLAKKAASSPRTRPVVP